MPHTQPAPPTSGDHAGDWREQELLLMREVMRLVGRGPSPAPALAKMLHLMSELLGLNRGRIVLVDPPGPEARAPRQASIQHAYGLTQAERDRGRYLQGEGITGRVLASGLQAGAPWLSRSCRAGTCPRARHSHGRPWGPAGARCPC